MHIEHLAVPDVVLITPTLFEDQRGFFYESYNARSFESHISSAVHFVQDNHSRSSHGVLRGLHYQLPPHPQGKLVRCVSGKIFDVAVDVRQSSQTFGRWVGAWLSCENNRQLWIPEGFAHGFLAVSESADVIYKTTGYYSPECERSIRFDDIKLNISWPLSYHEMRLSDKDLKAPPLSSAEVFP